MASREINLSSIEPRAAHDLLISAVIPRPIAWVTSTNADGQVNLAPFSFFNGVTWHPPTLCVSIVNRRDGSRKDTLLNIEETGNFAVNMVTEDLGELMVATSVTFPREVDEAKQAGVALCPSTTITSPRVRDAGIAFECLLGRIVTIGDGPHGANLVLGRIQLMHVEDELLDSDSRIDAVRSRLLGRLGGTKYCKIRSILDIVPPE